MADEPASLMQTYKFECIQSNPTKQRIGSLTGAHHL